MGAALRVSDANHSAWIVDGGSNSGVMKLAGEARSNMGSIALNVPLIGIGVAIEGPVTELYETKGHSHLIIAVDRNGGCPTKVVSMVKKHCSLLMATELKMRLASHSYPQEDGKVKVDSGYEIGYTKLFEDFVSMTFHVPIVGLLGLQPHPFPPEVYADVLP